MIRKLVLVGAAIAASMNFSFGALAGANDYVFEPVSERTPVPCLVKPLVPSTLTPIVVVAAPLVVTKPSRSVRLEPLSV